MLSLRDGYYQHSGVSKERDTAHELGSRLLPNLIPNGNSDLNQRKHSFGDSLFALLEV